MHWCRCLREPVDRLLSLYNHCGFEMWRNGRLMGGCTANVSFSEWVDLEV